MFANFASNLFFYFQKKITKDSIEKFLEQEIFVSSGFKIDKQKKLFNFLCSIGWFSTNETKEGRIH